MLYPKKYEDYKSRVVVQKVHINIRLCMDIYSLRVEEEKESIGKDTWDRPVNFMCMSHCSCHIWRNLFSSILEVTAILPEGLFLICSLIAKNNNNKIKQNHSFVVLVISCSTKICSTYCTMKHLWFSYFIFLLIYRAPFPPKKTFFTKRQKLHFASHLCKSK